MKIEKKTGKFKSTEDVRIYYETRGHGRPLIFCYGIGCLINHWQFQIRAFSQDYNTVAFDYRGHHLSDIPKDKSTMTIEDLAQDLVNLVEHLGYQDAVFLGHSFGVQVLMKAHEMRPELFKGFVFINGFASNPMQDMFGNDTAIKLFQAVKMGYQMLPETATMMYKLAVENPIAMQLSGLLGGFNVDLTHFKDIEIYARGLTSMDLDCFIRLFEEMMEYDGREQFEKINCPTLIVSGTKDSVTPKKFQAEMHDKIRGSEFLSVPLGSHCTQLDMPDFVNLRISNFLKGIPY